MPIKPSSKTLLHPQEIETYYVLPTIRRYFALTLKESGMKQKDIAQLMGISSATISQYSSSKRGHQVQFPEDLIVEIKTAAVRIKDRLSYFRETQHILHRIREQCLLCQIHHQFSDVPDDCQPHEIGCHVKKMGLKPSMKPIMPTMLLKQ